MQKQKPNVFLSSAFNIHGLSGCKQCGVFETNALHGIITDIKNTQIPDTSCIRSLSTNYTEDYLCDMGNGGISTNERLIISVWPTDKKCAIRDKKNCPRCIAAGKCRDEFVINLIGKKLFAEKYQGK